MTRLQHGCWLAVPIALACIAASASGCGSRKSESYSREAPSSDWVRLLPAPADKEVTDLLEGLKPGESIQGYPIAAVGAVTPEGVIPIVFIKDGQGATIKIAQRADVPSPPANSRHFGVYFEPFDGMKPLPSADLMNLVNSIADRLKRTEDKVPQPKGMKPLPRPSQPA